MKTYLARVYILQGVQYERFQKVHEKLMATKCWPIWGTDNKTKLKFHLRQLLLNNLLVWTKLSHEAVTKVYEHWTYFFEKSLILKFSFPWNEFLIHFRDLGHRGRPSNSDHIKYYNFSTRFNWWLDKRDKGQQLGVNDQLGCTKKHFFQK